ncbi:hypothetical protein P691DRAFT_795734 [Macrolepiota fuliginosa MF-IS2]|uniref:MADS-box domain-containing protein n=1 Tax=Macrolepiota fuliginosa MF-IS2 TaxID=1400762 RepID=A0A9P5X9H4_9AGAR|nr:hypothetical protein P691DRAFT_795734 [Macrolepiota fuliginosa MF-IS2]
MGRRKIEIQPITASHERNRSVTFLKRKNGLFKKAYELGVLCSVDVAVIIFEERPGHHLKLYQYCSSDIHDIVQRHLRHDGEKDTRGPQDFAGNANNKIDDTGDGDDDDPDDDDDGPSRRRGDSKLKRGSDLTMSGNDIDFMHNRGLSLPQAPLPMHGMASGSSLPVSNDRHNLRNHPSHHAKRPRTDHPNHNRSPSDDHLPSGSTAYHYQTGSGASFSRTGGPYHHSGNSQYTPLYPVSNHTTPPPVFIPLQPEFGSSSSRGPTPRTAGPGPPPAFSAARSSSANSSYDTSMYPGMMRPPQSSHHPSSGGGSGGGGGDLFTAFLDADEHSRQSQSQGFGLDWPVHSSSTSSGPPPANPPPAVSNPSANSSSGPAEGSSNWLDFLSGNPNQPASGRDPSMSWERSGGDNRADITDMFGSGGGGGGGGGGQTASPLGVGMGSMTGNKRRVGSDADDPALVGSPGSLGGIGNDKKDLKPEGGG